MAKASLVAVKTANNMEQLAQQVAENTAKLDLILSILQPAQPESVEQPAQPESAKAKREKA